MDENYPESSRSQAEQRLPVPKIACAFHLTNRLQQINRSLEATSLVKSMFQTTLLLPTSICLLHGRFFPVLSKRSGALRLDSPRVFLVQ